MLDRSLCHRIWIYTILCHVDCCTKIIWVQDNNWWFPMLCSPQYCPSLYLPHLPFVIPSSIRLCSDTCVAHIFVPYIPLCIKTNFLSWLLNFLYILLMSPFISLWAQQEPPLHLNTLIPYHLYWFTNFDPLLFSFHLCLKPIFLLSICLCFSWAFFNQNNPPLSSSFSFDRLSTSEESQLGSYWISYGVLLRNRSKENQNKLNDYIRNENI